MPRTIVCEWDAPSTYPYVILDSLFPGGLFTSPKPDPSVDHYEVERYDQTDGTWMTVGYPRNPKIEFDGEDFDNATVRIRVILRDGTKTPYVSSGSFQVQGMIADFESLNNITLLSFI